MDYIIRRVQQQLSTLTGNATHYAHWIFFMIVHARRNNHDIIICIYHKLIVGNLPAFLTSMLASPKPVPNNDKDMNANLDRFPFVKPDLKPSLKAVFDSAAQQASNLGFEYCAYHLRFPVPVSNPAVVMLDNFPAAWHARYHEKNYLFTDPTLIHALHYQTPVVWTDGVFAKARELWIDMQAHGLNVGWAQPARDARNSVGLLTVARSEGALMRNELKEKQPLLAWLAQTTHLAITRQLASLFINSINTRLSQREIDVLRWTAEGKTAGEISQILTISERTVNFHANNAVLKLGVANKTAAAAHAALLGML